MHRRSIFTMRRNLLWSARKVSWGQSMFRISQPILGLCKMRSFVLIALAVTIGSTSHAVAQSSNIEGRVGRLEKEMKAVQRKVFPGGGSQYFEPQIAPELGRASCRERVGQYV